MCTKDFLPSVSIYIPTYNRPHLLRRALNSLIRERYENMQVLVCDDGSVESYSDVIADFKSKFSDLIYVKNESPAGACYSRNRLINMADGEYITGLDDDDEFLHGCRISDFVNFPMLNKYAYLCTGHIVNYGNLKLKSRVRGGEISFDELCFSNRIGNQIFTKLSVLKSVGGFDVGMPAWQDYDTWMRISRLHGNGYKLNKYSYQWNIDHELGRISSSSKAKIGYELFIQKHSKVLTRSHLRSLAIQDIINRGEYLGIKKIIRSTDRKTFPIAAKYYVSRKVKKLLAAFK